MCYYNIRKREQDYDVPWPKMEKTSFGIKQIAELSDKFISKVNECKSLMLNILSLKEQRCLEEKECCELEHTNSAQGQRN